MSHQTPATSQSQDDGGSAFPEVFSTYDEGRRHLNDVYSAGGMSLRDYFAAQFMARAQSLSEDRDGGWNFENAAGCAYEMADAMLKARGQ